MTSTNSDIHVLVTGGTGFIAGHLCYQLLTRSYHVHATVRSLEKGAKELREALLEYDQSHHQDSNVKLTEELLQQRLHVFEADLLKEGSFAQALNGCQFVHHTASPYILNVKDPQKDLVDPALKGTMNVLGECVKLREKQSKDDPKRLQRIILTSSIAAIVDTPEIDKVYTENDWNELSELYRNPYFYSKTVSEKAAWKYLTEMEEKHGPDFLELAVINPCGVIGESIFPKQLNQSHETITKLCNGELPIIISLSFTYVDVKDVALAHVQAMILESDNKSRFAPSKKERFITACGDSVPMKEIIEYLKEVFPNPPNTWTKNLPTFNLEGTLGTYIVKFSALFQPKFVRQVITANIGRPQLFDNSKSRQVLEINYIGWKQQVKETVNYMIKAGYIKC